MIVAGLSITSVGEELLPSNNARVERNRIEGANGAGIAVVDSSGAVIAENVVRDAGGPGVMLDLAKDSLVRANDVRGNQGGIVVDESPGNTIELNNASGGLGSGIEVGALHSPLWVSPQAKVSYVDRLDADSAMPATGPALNARLGLLRRGQSSPDPID